VHCGRVASVKNYYSDKIGPPEKIVVLISVLEMFPNSFLELKKLFTHMPVKYGINFTLMQVWIVL
jgi:hypothetical protein